MNLEELKKEAEKRVSLEFDAWKDLDGVEREAEIYKAMLRMIDEKEDENFTDRLLVARAVWLDKVWSATSESFAGYLCEVGGRYQQKDGRPSGVAYDLAGYVSVVWDALESLGENPVKVALSGWSKARLTVATVRENIIMIDSGGQETKSSDKATSVKVIGPESIKEVVRMAKDEDVTFREMASKTWSPRVPSFSGVMSLKKDGTWRVELENLSEQQMALVQRVLKGHAELRLA